MKRFLPWLIPIIGLLIAIPFLLIAEIAGIAKVAGVIVVVLTSVAIRFWLYNANKNRVGRAHVKLTVNERYFLNEFFPYYKVMASADKKALEERVGLLLAEVSFDEYDHRDPDKNDCLAFAVIVSLVVKGETYSSCHGKIVVFRGAEVAELGNQSGKALLFIDKSELFSTMRTYNGTMGGALLSSETAEILKKFYYS